MKKQIFLLLLLICLPLQAFASIDEHITLGEKFLSQYQYSSAIGEYRKALRIDNSNKSALTGLINSYLARATYYANKDQNWTKAANDYRSAIFYLKIYSNPQTIQNSAAIISSTVDNLEQCFTLSNFNKSHANRYQTAVNLRSQGEFAAAGYEFNSIVSDSSFAKRANEQLADIMNVLNNNNKAAEYYRKAVSLAPNDVVLRMKYARILDKLNQYDLAVKEYNFALSHSSDNKEVLYALERIYTKKLATEPNNAELNSNLGAILQKEGKLDEALTYYKKAETINPDNLTNKLNLGTLYQQQKNYSKASAIYNDVLAMDANNVNALFFKAQADYELNNFDVAIEEFKKIISLDPANTEAQKYLFTILTKKLSPEDAIKEFSTTGTMTKEMVNVLYQNAIDLHKKNNMTASINYYNEVLKYDSNNPEVYVNLALAHVQNKDFKSANEVLSAAKSKFPSNAQILNTCKLLTNEMISGKYDEAAQFFNAGNYQKALDIYLKIQPQTTETLIATAACYKSLEKFQQAIEYYKRALDTAPKNAELAYNIGVLYAQQENWSAAKIYLQKALTLNPNHEDSKDLLSSVIEQNNVVLINKMIDLYNKGIYQDGLRIISQVLTEDPKNAFANYYRGLIYDAQKKNGQAIEEYKKALINNPELVIAEYLMAVDYDVLANYKESLKHYKKFIQLSTTDDEYTKYAKTRINDLKAYE